MVRMRCKVSALLGKTLNNIEVNNVNGGDEIIFFCQDGAKYRMYHEQDCSESVFIEDICGSLPALIGKPLTMAEDVSNKCGRPAKDPWVYSCTWTWYKFATVTGYVTIRWYGESNGQSSEGVDFEIMEDDVNDRNY